MGSLKKLRRYSGEKWTQVPLGLDMSPPGLEDSERAPMASILVWPPHSLLRALGILAVDPSSSVSKIKLRTEKIRSLFVIFSK